MSPAATCPQCKKGFTHKSNLYRHLRTHSENRERKFQCTNGNCKYRAYNNGDLQSHIQRTHAEGNNYECNLCQAKFKSRTGRNAHVISVHCQEKAYACDKCPARFSCQGSLKDHAFTHTDEKPYSCTICFKKFKRPVCLSGHLKNVHQNSPTRKRFVCKLCPKSYAYKNGLYEHTQAHHSLSTFSCNFCKKSFVCKPNLERHINMHTGEKPYFCSYDTCLCSFASSNALRDHKQRHHPNLIPDDVSKPVKKKPESRCPHCCKVLSSKSNLIQHLRIHSVNRERSFKCLVSGCGKTFLTKPGLKFHSRITHSNKKNYECNFCDAKFKSKLGRDDHILRVHCHERSFQCDKCPKKFSQKFALSDHALSHTEEKRYTCPTCHKKFKRPGCLRQHIRSMHENAQYICQICDRSFGHEGNLRRHKKVVHDWNKLPGFRCYFCNKSFVLRQDLELHMVLHTNEKPFMCSVPSCTFLCSHGNTLRAHVQRDHPSTIRPVQRPLRMWSCYFCSRQFIRQDSLIIHLRKHTMEVPFHCVLCKMGFNSGSSLNRHITSHTKDKPLILH